MVSAPNHDLSNPLGPVVIYDGWHRAAAWFEHIRSGRQYPILADLIITEGPDPARSVLYKQDAR